MSMIDLFQVLWLIEIFLEMLYCSDPNKPQSLANQYLRIAL